MLSDSIILSLFPAPHRLVIIKIIIFLSSWLKYIEIEFLVKIYYISLLKDLIAEIQVGTFTTGCSKWTDHVVWLHTETSDLRSILRCFLNTSEASHHKYTVTCVQDRCPCMCGWYVFVGRWILSSPKCPLSQKAIKWRQDVNFTVRCIQGTTVITYIYFIQVTFYVYNRDEWS